MPALARGERGVGVAWLEERSPQPVALAAEVGVGPVVGGAEKAGLWVGLALLGDAAGMVAEVIVVEHAHKLAKVDIGHGRLAEEEELVLVVLGRRVVAEVGRAGDDDGVFGEWVDQQHLGVDEDAAVMHRLLVQPALPLL